MEDQPGDAAVVVVNFSSSSLLEANLASMRLPARVFVVIVDCFSGGPERSRVRSLTRDRGWEAVLLDDNRGFGGGVNAGVERATEKGADVIVALNPDATIDERSLSALIAAARDDGDALVSPRILAGDGSVWFAGSDLYLDDGTMASLRRRDELEGRPRRAWATGACFAVSRDLWRRVGGFDEDYFLYWEDVDLSHRIEADGGHLVLLDDAVAVHDEGQTHGRASGARAKSATYYYYNIRNRLLYAAKNLDDERLSRWMRTAPAVSYRILLQGGRRQLLTSLAPWRAYRRGLRDGRAWVTRHRADPRDPNR